MTEGQTRIAFNNAIHPPEALSSSSRSPLKDESPRRRQRKRPRKGHEKDESTDSELLVDE
jgi:hypothetical protein